MANKKFYYRNKSKSAAKAQMEIQSKAVEKYSPRQLAMTLDDLALSDSAKKLLSSSGIITAADLVVRSEKDMYKVQGLNKRVLFEIKDALGKNGMSLYVEPVPQSQSEEKAEQAAGKPQAQKNVPKQKQQPQNKAQTQATAEKPRAEKIGGKQDKKGEERSSKFGLADRHEQAKPSVGRDAKPLRPEKPERLTEPLPIEQWRKVIKGGKWGFSDGFKIVIPPMYDEVFSFKEGLASVEIDGKCGYIDSENNVIIPLEYDLAMSFSEGLAMVARGEKCGYINKQNELVIDFLYDAASPFEEGEAKVKKDGKWATLTPDGKLAWI